MALQLQGPERLGLGLGRFDAGQPDLPRRLEFTFGEGRLAQNFGRQTQSAGQVGRYRLDTGVGAGRAAALLLGGATYCQTLPTGVQKVTSVEGITEYAYPNGLHVLLFPDTSKPKVTVNITYLVGSRQEGYGETGMAHLLEHLMFRETKTRTNIKKELTDHGAQMNGTTAWDRTNYFETVNATDENLRWALELEADRMVNTRVEKEILDKEMTVVRNEFEAGENNPVNMMFQRLLETCLLYTSRCV